MSDLKETTATSNYSQIFALRASHHGFFKVDAQWTVKCWNREAGKLLGIQAIDIVNENLWSKFAAAIPQDFYMLYHKVSIQDIPIQFEGYWDELGAFFEVVTYYFDGTLSFYFKSSTEWTHERENSRPSGQRHYNRKTDSVAKLILYMAANELRVLLADDDKDDCLFFKEALEELPLSTGLTIVNDGDQLMKLLLKNKSQLPHVLFLDLNMPRKNGFECLKEIRLNDKLKALPAIIYSTSSGQDVVGRLYENGAQYFIQKPFDFLQFKRVIHYSLTLIMQETRLPRTKNNFVLTGENDFIRPKTI